MTTFKFQLISDIHLENYEKLDFTKLIKPVEPVLFLAGDIGHINTKIYKDFMNYVSENWDVIYIVLGNHEFYSNGYGKVYTYNELYEMYEDFFLSYPNIILVSEGYEYKINPKYTNNETIYIIGGIGIPTLEDNIKLLGEEYYNANDYYKQEFNDFNNIYIDDKRNNDKWDKDQVNNNNKLITVEYFNNLSKISKSLLIESINELSKLKEENGDKSTIILLTHYPYGIHSLTSSSQFHQDSDIRKKYFCNDINNPINRTIINSANLLIAGHTHYSYDFTYNNAKYISNQYGYCNQNGYGKTEKSGFITDKSFNFSGKVE
jgi:predicted MPP superfamily phosphohydrolase